MRVGVIGTGFGAQHLEWLRECPELKVTVLGYHRNRERALDLAARFGIGAVTGDCAGLAAGGDVDAIVITSPPSTHLELGLPAVERGLLVMCEKPLAATLEAATVLAAAARKHRARTAVTFQWRENGAFGYLRERLAEGAVGEVLLVDVLYHHDFLAGEGTAWPWRHSRALAGAGALGDLGVHAFDLLRWSTGREWVAAGAQVRVARAQRRWGDRVIACETDDVALVNLVCATPPAVGRVLVSRVSHDQAFEIRVVGTNGTLRVSVDPTTGSGTAEHLPGGSARHSYTFRPSPMNPYHRLVRDLAAGTASVADFGDGLAAQVLLEQAARAAA